MNAIERHIGAWKRVDSDKTAIGELIINGNQIEFYSRDVPIAFPTTHIGGDKQNRYLIKTNGFALYEKNKTLDQAAGYNVDYAILYNGAGNPECNVEKIIGVSFMIPELIDWFRGIQTVHFFQDSDANNLCAEELEFPPLVLHKNSPYITLGFESSSYNETMRMDSPTTVILRNEPRLYIEYKTPVGVTQVRSDIRALMQFWGLLIGRVSCATDIRLDIKDNDFKSWLYLNVDFSHNIRARGVIGDPRTTFSGIGDLIENSFTNWYQFSQKQTYDLIRNMYFSANDSKDIFAEDIFVLYVKILEGYHLRISGDEESDLALKQAINASSKEIKKLIFTDEGKPLFQTIFDSVNPEWSFNSRHANDVAEWIAKGYLGRTGLSERIKLLDNDFFEVIAMNASILFTNFEQELDDNIIKSYYDKIVATRNYYSHFKHDTSNILTFAQMHKTIFVLKTIVTMIMLSVMGLEKDKIREIICCDEELRSQTKFLRNNGEKIQVNQSCSIDHVRNSPN